jgi:hypothetical protein
MPVAPGEADSLRATLKEMAPDPARSIVPFGQLDGVHFARLVLADPPAGGSNHELVFLLDCDAPASARLRQLVTDAGPGLDAVLQHCSGYPAAAERAPRARHAYLRAHRVKESAVYVNVIGLTLRQIREEAALRDAIEDFLDEHRDEWTGKPATSVREAIRDFVRSRDDLRPTLEPAPRPSLTWRIGEWLHLGGSLLLAAAVAPFALVASPVLIFMLRRRELTDPAPRLVPDDAHVAELADLEDRLAQNQFTAVGEVKPGRFRQYVARVVLWGVNLATRHYFNRGSLTGVNSIHAARWVFLDDYRRLIFASNYDGSLENYMDDFIDKVAWGLNAVFSNGIDYPRTNWLIRNGAKDEQAFKGYIRTKQHATEVWYTAYGQLTNLNIQANARIRAGLHGTMDEAAAATWLKLF